MGVPRAHVPTTPSGPHAEGCRVHPLSSDGRPMLPTGDPAARACYRQDSRLTRLRLAKFKASAALLAAACSHPTEEQPRSRDGAAATKPLPGAEASDNMLRKLYRAEDFSLAPCVRRRSSDIVGTRCPAGFSVYGPYAEAPANSDVEFVLEIQPSTAATVVIDLVSEVGEVFHAGTPPVLLQAGERRWLGLRVHLFSRAHKLEARVAARGDVPVDYVIRGLALDVH